MGKIAQIRPVLLSCPYADENSAEVQVHLPHGYRTCGLVEITLDNGVKGIGEGYIAVFAPRVFESIVHLITPYLIGREVSRLRELYALLCDITGYWSLEGAARHVVSALEIALVDARAQELGVPAYDLFGGKTVDTLRLYGSGGDSQTPEEMRREFALLKTLSIDLFKIRARNHQVNKTIWTLEEGAKEGLHVAVDMCQNLNNPAQSVGDVVRFLEAVSLGSDKPIAFLEEALGPMDIESYPLLRRKISVPVCGGEVVTTGRELSRRVELKYYDFVQPDATVIGGIGQTVGVFDTCRDHGITAVVHCWGGAVCMMANYHAAFASHAVLAEYPMPAYALREELMAEPLIIRDGRLSAPHLPGLGVRLTPEIEKKYRFREEAVYNCAGNPAAMKSDTLFAKEG